MRLLIRADASSRIGIGHVMRCLALGQAWQAAGGTVDFLTRSESSGIVDRLVSEGIQVSCLGDGSDWPAMENIVHKGCPPDALVLDGYHFDPDYQRRARDLCRPLVVIDDMAHLSHYCADIILNQNIHARELCYIVEPQTRLLLGCQWALLRKEFQQWRGWQRKLPRQAKKVLVTLGGSDPENVSLTVIQGLNACMHHCDLRAVIVAGGSNPNVSSLKRAVASSRNIELRSDVNDMPSLMAWADIAITAAGSTCLETSFMGLPSMTFVVADNQEGVAHGLEEIGASINLGWQGNLSARRIASEIEGLVPAHSRRQRMSETGRSLVDGQGAFSVLAAIQKWSAKNDIVQGGRSQTGAQLPRS